MLHTARCKRDIVNNKVLLPSYGLGRLVADGANRWKDDREASPCEVIHRSGTKAIKAAALPVRTKGQTGIFLNFLLIGLVK
jgi:hypothetical protein